MKLGDPSLGQDQGARDQRCDVLLVICEDEVRRVLCAYTQYTAVVRDMNYMYLHRRLHQQCDYEHEGPSEGPPHAEGAHATDGARPDGVDDPRRDVHAPRYGGDLNSRERAPAADFSEGRKVKSDAEVAGGTREDHGNAVDPTSLEIRSTIEEGGRWAVLTQTIGNDQVVWVSVDWKALTS